jgi:hypothetical protein
LRAPGASSTAASGVEAERLGGFCLLLKREVLTKIGWEKGGREKGSDPLNLEGQTPFPGAGLDLFDTDVLSVRARQTGYTLACCKDLFIHHFGTRTFAHGGPSVPAGVAGGRL